MEPLTAEQREVLTVVSNEAGSLASAALDLINQYRLVKGSDPDMAYRQTTYEWLPKVPTTFTEEHLEMLDLKEWLYETYHNMDRVKTAIGHVEKNMKDHDQLGSKIKKLSSELRLLTGELKEAMPLMKMDVPMVTDMMPDDIKDLNSQTDRDTRDWLIIKNTVDICTYTVAVFKYFNFSGKF